MNILIIGGGGREHTIAWKLAQSPNCGKLFVAPGNAGTHEIGTNLAIGINDFADIKKAVLSNDIQMVIVGPEDPLVNGIHNFFLKDKQLKYVIVVGPQKDAATLKTPTEYGFIHQQGNAARWYLLLNCCCLPLTYTKFFFTPISSF